jgi:hypothetical protein
LQLQIQDDKNPAAMPRRRATTALEHCRTLIRQLGAWVGLLSIVAQLSSSFHLLLVEHVRCAEHGDWVHADGEHADGLATERSQSSAHELQLAASNGESGHEHDHCVVCAERRRLAPLPPGTSELRAPDRAAEAPHPHVRVFSRTTRLYAMAPKTSPPA